MTSVSTSVHRDFLASRAASALTGSVSIDLGFPPAGIVLPSNLRDTTKLKQYTQELRLASTGAGPFQWVVGGFYSHVDRTYHQRLPTPGYDAFTNAFFAAGCVPDDPSTPLVNEGAGCKDPILGIPLTAADVDNGFGLVDNPYHADLPYVIKQEAVFGEASYKFNQLKITAGGRYYSFQEKRRFNSGGLLAAGDARTDKTKSDGCSPRAVLRSDPNTSPIRDIQ